MTQFKTRTQLYNLFKSGAQPSEADFKDLIDASLNRQDDRVSKPPGADTPLRISTYGDAENVLDIYTGETPTWRLSQRPAGAAPGLNLAVGESSKLFIESSTGNLGLGTIQPRAKLTVEGDAAIAGQTRLANSLRVLGTVDIGDGSSVTIANGHMASGSLTLGSLQTNYGGGAGWNPNTAGLLLETQANTEIAVHDSAQRVISLMYYEGNETNQLSIGRNMGWGLLGLLNVQSPLRVEGEATITSSLAVAGNTALTGPLSVTQAVTVASSLTVAATTTLNGHLKAKTVYLGNFSPEDRSEWPHVAWLREGSWDEGLIKLPSQTGAFGRAGFGIHMNASREFGLWSTGPKSLLAVEGGTGNTKIAGNLSVAGSTQLGEALTVGGAVAIAGPTQLSSTLTVQGETAIAASLAVTGNTTLTGPLAVDGTARMNGHLSANTITLGDFSPDDTFQWPAVTWLRESGWDEGLIKMSSSTGAFGRAGFGIHLDASREFGFWSTGSKSLLSVEGGTGNTKIAGNLQVGGTVYAQFSNPLHHRMYPSDPIVYQDIFAARDNGAISRYGSPSIYNDTSHTSQNPWHGRPILQYGADNEADGNGALINIPEGYDTVWLRVLGERWAVAHAYFIDGSKEKLGLWAGGYRYANCYCPDGSLSDGRVSDSITHHQWLPIPAGRSGQLAITPKLHTHSGFWLSGVAFSTNPWAHATQSAVGYHWTLNGGDAIEWSDTTWHSDVLGRIPANSNALLKVPVVPSGRDKLLYLIEHDNTWNGCMHKGIMVNGQAIERFLASYDNPFARHWRGKAYQRYIAARIPASLINPAQRHLDVRIDITLQGYPIYLREMGTHDLDLPFPA
ncbi:MAG: hypothetical protein AAGG51_20155 [Cyanobacteria bacterium P01_G01_bin.54]